MILEPCCFHKQLSEIINGKNTTEHLFTFGDTDLQMLMDCLVSYAPECDVYLALVKVEPDTLYSITKLMEAKVKGTDRHLVKSFVLLSQGDVKHRKAIYEALEKYRQEGRLIICEHETAFRCLCVGNDTRHFILQGSIPQTKNFAMQMFTLTTDKDNYEKVMRILNYREKCVSYKRSKVVMKMISNERSNVAK